MVVAADYLHALQGLLPSGPAWPRDEDAPITRLLGGVSVELARIDARAESLSQEALLSSTYEMLADWERTAALLPFSIVDGTAISIDQRRANLIAKMVKRGGQSIAYFIAEAAYLGYAITITEFGEWSVNNDVEAALGGASWNFAWQVNAASGVAVDWSVESDVETAFLIIWVNALLEARLQEDKPAHTVLLFSYF